MKLSVLIATIVLSFASMASTVLNGVTLSNLPKASKNYFKEVSHESEFVPVQDAMRGECQRDKAEAEAFIQNSGSQILSSKGCAVIFNPGYTDQGGYKSPSYSTSFEIIFK